MQLPNHLRVRRAADAQFHLHCGRNDAAENDQAGDQEAKNFVVVLELFSTREVWEEWNGRAARKNSEPIFATIELPSCLACLARISPEAQQIAAVGRGSADFLLHAQPPNLLHQAKDIIAPRLDARVELLRRKALEAIECRPILRG